LQQAQAAMEKAFQAVQPQGGLGRAVKATTAAVHRYAVASTPWDSGGRRAAERMTLTSQRRGMVGIVDIDPSARNPRQGNSRPYEYGYHLHEQGLVPGVRGGIRAFFLYTVDTYGGRALQEGAAELRRALP
jgi:hypothetical protein